LTAKLGNFTYQAIEQLYYLSPFRSGIDKAKKDVSREAAEKHDAEQKGFAKLDFDGKTRNTASANGRTKKKDHPTAVRGRTGKHAEHFTPPTGSGRNAATGTMKVINDTDPVHTLRATGRGKKPLIIVPIHLLVFWQVKRPCTIPQSKICNSLDVVVQTLPE
jgi:hypothetical protein